jgi:hypothetical protein
VPPYLFPADVFDSPTALLAAVGTFWLNTYQGRLPVMALLHARAQLEAQNYLDLLRLIASMSRFTVPVFRRENWYLLRLQESQLNRTAANLAQFDGTYAFDGTLLWGVPAASGLNTWAAPGNLAGVKLAMNRITDASLTLVHGVDFVLDPASQSVTFRDNPFDNPLVPVRDVVDDNQVVDREAALWLYAGEFDLDTVYQQFGYALGLKLASSDGYRDLVNALFDGLVDGGTQLSVDRVFAAVAGVPLARASGEVVEHVLVDDRYLWVITDQNAYRFDKRVDVLVAPGDVLALGQGMTDVMRVYEFGSGQVPGELTSLAVPRGHLAWGYFHDLNFANEVVPLVVEEGVQGYTKVSFAVGGFPGDVERFWDDVHARGVAAGQTLAMLMDQRPADARDTQPTALALPATVNPMGFLVQNVFRNNLWVVRLKPSLFGDGALGLQNLSALRKVIPAHTAVLVVVQLAVADDPVILDAPGDATRPGYQEWLTSFSAAYYNEILASTLIVESVRARQMAGRCL